MILSVVSKIKKLGIKPEYIVEQAEEIYEKYPFCKAHSLYLQGGCNPIRKSRKAFRQHRSC